MLEIRFHSTPACPLQHMHVTQKANSRLFFQCEYAFMDRSIRYWKELLRDRLPTQPTFFQSLRDCFLTHFSSTDQLMRSIIVLSHLVDGTFSPMAILKLSEWELLLYYNTFWKASNPCGFLSYDVSRRSNGNSI